MCTLSFLPDTDGYVVAMNRDELKCRAVARGPATHSVGGVCAAYPQEESGGTWIAATTRGNLLAVLNWNLTAEDQLPEKQRSRGEIIPSLLQEETPKSVESVLRANEMTGMRPFRLIGIFLRNREVREWRWDGQQLSTRWHEWTRNHWFSSSRSDARAENTRRRACEMMWQEGFHGASDWFRALHASHLPEAGAYSICVHREDASTVSFTEVRYGGGELAMTYIAGNPCAPVGAPITIHLPVELVHRAAQ